MNIACFLAPDDRVQLHALMARIERGSRAGESAASSLGLGPADMAVDLTPVLALYCATAQFDRAESILCAMKASGEWPVAHPETAMKLFALAAHGLSKMRFEDDAPAQWAINFVFELAYAGFPPAARRADAQTTEAR